MSEGDKMLQVGYELLITALLLFVGYVAYLLLRLLIRTPRIAWFLKGVILVAAVGVVLILAGLIREGKEMKSIDNWEVISTTVNFFVGAGLVAFAALTFLSQHRFNEWAKRRQEALDHPTLVPLGATATYKDSQLSVLISAANPGHVKLKASKIRITSWVGLDAVTHAELAFGYERHRNKEGNIHELGPIFPPLSDHAIPATFEVKQGAIDFTALGNTAIDLMLFYRGPDAKEKELEVIDIPLSLG